MSGSNMMPKHKRQAGVKYIKYITFLHITFLHEQGHTRMYECTVQRSRCAAARAVGAIWCEQMLWACLYSKL